MTRYGLRDDEWERIKGLLPGKVGDVGVTAQDNRRFVEAVLYRYRAGIPWRDLPERFGGWKNTHRRFSRWAKSKRSVKERLPLVVAWRDDWGMAATTTEVSTTGLVDTKQKLRQAQASAVDRGIEASDRGRDAGAGRVGLDRGPAP